MEQSAAQNGTVLVTGGSGYLGGWSVIELLRQGYRVRTTVRDLGREPEVRRMLGTEVEAGDRLSVMQADLNADDGWADAVSGCDYVLHVASPFPSEQPKDPDELIVPAREGALRVLRASLDAGVRRIVMTSSVAAIRNTAGDPGPGPLTEENWTDPDNLSLTPYTRSKTIAERAAWDLVRERGEVERLAVVNPGAILGPVLSEDLSFSIQVIARMMGGMPGVPRLSFTFVDVRDVAQLQVAAMTAPEAAGERFIAVTSFLWMSDVARILRDGLGERGANIRTRTVPNLLVRAMARLDPSLRSIVGDLGKKTDYSNEKAVSRLGWKPRPIEETIVDTAESLTRVGAVQEGA
jgi:nucleoside-diphosphate-sugar epimerase